MTGDRKRVLTVFHRAGQRMKTFAKDLLGGKMTHPMEIKDIRVFILNGKETHILVAPLASEIMD